MLGVRVDIDQGCWLMFHPIVLTDIDLVVRDVLFPEQGATISLILGLGFRTDMLAIRVISKNEWFDLFRIPFLKVTLPDVPIFGHYQRFLR